MLSLDTSVLTSTVASMLPTMELPGEAVVYCISSSTSRNGLYVYDYDDNYDEDNR